ncbi:MAG: methionyl-tRNA formyltransferase [Deltaproteobacteria bacterium]|nr:methionyl-tRNA formyltransferase [Deltaproteobacteria bacterium]
MGTPAFALPSFEALVEAGHEVAAVVTQPDKPVGRGLENRPSPVKQAAEKRAIPALTPVKIHERGFVERLKSLKPDCIVVVAYGKILPEDALGIPPLGCINVHASLLPKYRGAAPVNRAIINGERETGVCTMLLDKGMDTGPVFLCESTPIGEDETFASLYERLSKLGAALLVKTLGLVEKGKITPSAQDEKKASYAPMLKKSDGLIDWAKDAVAIKNLVAGVCPWPGAFTHWNKKTLKIHTGGAAHWDNIPTDAMPGTVILASNGRIIVKCGKGAFEMRELQPENKNRMGATDFLKGYRLKEGERFE